MDKLKKLKNQYDEVIKDLIQKIGDKTVNLVVDYPFEDDGREYMTFHTNEQYDIKSVCVIRNTLYFNVDLVTIDCDGNVIYFDDQMSLDEIPICYVYDILEWIYKFI